MNLFNKITLTLGILVPIMGAQITHADPVKTVRIAIYEQVGDVNIACSMNQVYLFADGKAILRMANLGEIGQVQIPAGTKQLRLRNISVGMPSGGCRSAIIENENGSSVKSKYSNGVDFDFNLEDNGVGRD